MPAKDFWKSKTFWFNVLALVVLVANPFGFLGFEPGEELTEYGAALVTLINLILRFVTSQPVRFRR